MPEQQDLANSAAIDLWGSTFAVPPNQAGTTSNLVNINSLPTSESRAWTITLLAQRYQGGALPVAAAVAAQPPDNQTTTGNQPRVNLTWATGNAQESCVLDYPARGSTISLHASTVRLQVSYASTAGGPPPILGAMISPSQRAHGLAGPPTFTTQGFQIPSGASVLFPIPARAAAYRVIQALPGLITADYIVEEVGNDGALIWSVDDSTLVTGATTQREYWPMHPQAQFIRIHPLLALPAPDEFAIQFQLDLG